MRKTVTIIGAGIAGLSAGCYLQMNGYDTEIFELHSLPGGFCTAWKRKDYTIDGCINWLAGSNPHDTLYPLWNELIDMKNLTFVNHEEYFRVEDTNGNYIRVFTDVDKLEQEFLEKAPEDKEHILELTNAIRKVIPLNLPTEKAPEVSNFLDGAKMILKLLPYLGTMQKWGRLSIREYAEKYTNPLLKKTISHLFFPDMAMLFVVMTLVWMHKKSAGYPLGGSLKFAQLIEKKYKELGGKIRYKAKVKKIMTENQSATGILLENGGTHTSDIVISAADGHYTIFDMLEGKYLNDEIRNYYENYDVFPSYVQVSLGIARTFEDEPGAVFFLSEPSLIIDNSSKYDGITLRIFNFDPTLAPEGKTVITAMFQTSDYLYWENLKKTNIEKYQSEKERIANHVIDILEKKYGNIRSHVEMIDVSTPSTVIRYTNNWKGSYEGWVLTPKIRFKQMKKVLPGLKNFYMAGQWVTPGGGLPTALMSGRNVTQIICKEDRKKFQTTSY